MTPITSSYLLLNSWKINLPEFYRNKKWFLDIDTTLKIKLTEKHLGETHLTPYSTGSIEMIWHQSIWFWERAFASTQFLEIQQNQLIELQEHSERYCKVLPVFRFNSSKHDLNSITSYLVTVPVNEQDIESTSDIIKSQVVSSKPCFIQSWIQWFFSEEQQTWIPSWKQTKLQKIKLFSHGSFHRIGKLQNKQLPSCDAFTVKLYKSIPAYSSWIHWLINLSKSGKTTQQAFIRIKVSKPQDTGVDNYHYLLQTWKQEKMSSFKDF